MPRSAQIIRVEARTELFARSFTATTDFMDRFDFELWRRNLEAARTALGARCVTGHVADEVWMAHWRAGRDPASALIDVLERAT